MQIELKEVLGSRYIRVIGDLRHVLQYARSYWGDTSPIIASRCAAIRHGIALLDHITIDIDGWTAIRIISACCLLHDIPFSEQPLVADKFTIHIQYIKVLTTTSIFGSSVIAPPDAAANVVTLFKLFDVYRKALCMETVGPGFCDRMSRIIRYQLGMDTGAKEINQFILQYYVREYAHALEVVRTDTRAYDMVSHGVGANAEDVKLLLSPTRATRRKRAPSSPQSSKMARLSSSFDTN